MVFHIVKKTDWEKYAGSEVYFSPSFEVERFIHLSEGAQIEGVLQRYYQGVNDLLLLRIDESLLEDKLKYEETSNGELFPHLYGGLDKKAVLEVVSL